MESCYLRVGQQILRSCEEEPASVVAETSDENIEAGVGSLDAANDGSHSTSELLLQTEDVAEQGSTVAQEEELPTRDDSFLSDSPKSETRWNGDIHEQENEPPPAPPKQHQASLLKRLDTIKGELSRKLNVPPSVPQILEESDDIELVQDGTSLYVTLPHKCSVNLVTLEEKIADRGTMWKEIQIDMQHSVLKGDELDAKKLTTREDCRFHVHTGVLNLGSLVAMKENSLIENVEFQSNSSSLSFSNCDCGLETCTAAGLGISIMNGSKLRMVNTEIANSKDVGVLINNDCSLTALNCKFLENAEQALLVAGGGKATVIKSDVTGEGIRVDGHGAQMVLKESYLIGGVKSSIVVCNKGFATMSSSVCFESRKHGLEVRGRGTNAKAQSCEFLNSDDHGVLVCKGGHANIEGSIVKGSTRLGIMLSDTGSKATVKSSELVANCAGGILLTTRATCIVQNCLIKGSPEGFGVGVEGYVAELTMLSCTVAENCTSEISVKHGALATIKDSKVSNSERGYALEITGEGSKVYGTSCILESDVGEAIFTSDGAEVAHSLK